jgi:hypothetical protein
VPRDVAALLDARIEVARPVQHERRALDAPERLAHVRLRVHEDEVADAARAQRRAAAAPHPRDRSGIRARHHRREVEVLAPALLELARVLLAPLLRRRPGVVVVGMGALRIGAVDDEGPHPLGIRGGEEDAHRPAFRVPEERRRLAPDGVHDRSHVVHPRLEVREPHVSVGQPGPALVEADEPGERPEPPQHVGIGRVLPVDLEMREEPGDEDEVERGDVFREAGDLVCDVHLSASRVADRRDHRVSSAYRKQSTVWSLTIPTDCMNA